MVFHYKFYYKNGTKTNLSTEDTEKLSLHVDKVLSIKFRHRHDGACNLLPDLWANSSVNNGYNHLVCMPQTKSGYIVPS